MDITLTRSSTESLGFSLVGGVNSSRGNSPVYVRSIAKGGIAAQDGRLHQGDEIIKINGIDLTHRSQDDVVKIIKITPGNLVLTVIPREVMLWNDCTHSYHPIIIKNSCLFILSASKFNPQSKAQETLHFFFVQNRTFFFTHSFFRPSIIFITPIISTTHLNSLSFHCTFFFGHMYRNWQFEKKRGNITLNVRSLCYTYLK